MLRPIVVTQKKDHFGLGYKCDKRERQRLIEEKRQKRIASFFGKERECKNGYTTTELLIPFGRFCLPRVESDNREKVMVDVAETFASLSINMVEVEDQKTRNTGLPLFPRGQDLNN